MSINVSMLAVVVLRTFLRIKNNRRITGKTFIDAAIPRNTPDQKNFFDLYIKKHRLKKSRIKLLICPMPKLNFTGKDSIASEKIIKKVRIEIFLLIDFRSIDIDPISAVNDNNVHIFSDNP